MLYRLCMPRVLRGSRHLETARFPPSVAVCVSIRPLSFRMRCIGERSVPAAVAGHAFVHRPHDVHESKVSLCCQEKSVIAAAPTLMSKLPEARELFQVKRRAELPFWSQVPEECIKRRSD